MDQPTLDLAGKGQEGIVLLVDKPMHWTSFDVIHRLRQWFSIEKAGHAGTLDPRATGLLIVCTGRRTKSIESFAGLEKEYTGTFELGITTASFDLETEVLERRDPSAVTAEMLESAVASFRGRQLQVPPMYSAVKHHGTPLYKFARKGKSVERAAKDIEIFDFTITSFQPPVAEFRVVCSKGTYIRSLVHDIGATLGCGAVLASLRRTRIGPYQVADALTMKQLDELRDQQGTLNNVEHVDSIPA